MALPSWTPVRALTEASTKAGGGTSQQCHQRRGRQEGQEVLAQLLDSVYMAGWHCGSLTLCLPVPAPSACLPCTVGSCGLSEFHKFHKEDERWISSCLSNTITCKNTCTTRDKPLATSTSGKVPHEQGLWDSPGSMDMGNLSWKSGSTAEPEPSREGSSPWQSKVSHTSRMGSSKELPKHTVQGTVGQSSYYPIKMP